MTDKHSWKLVVEKPEGDDVTYYYTHNEMLFPESRAKAAGFPTKTVDIDYQRKWWAARTKELVERVRTGMATTDDALMIEKFVGLYNNLLHDSERFLCNEPSDTHAEPIETSKRLSQSAD